MERERRKKARRELEWIPTVEASAQKRQKSSRSSRRSRPHTPSGGRQTEGEDSRASPFCPPHWPPVISAAERANRMWLLRELERAQSAQAKKRRRKGSKPVPVTRCTVYRRKKTVEEDNRILEEAGTVHHQQAPAGLPCNLCGQPKRLEFGHATYKGTSFCSNTSGQSAHDWLTEQRRKAGENKGRGIPKSTAWNMKRRRQKEQEAEELGISLKERKRPGYQICQLCGHQ
ncbi:uncharacterized protein LOC118823343 [Colossoma macropomum]|uniref:uncharacterized protein LOC118823343 n=1 Tax=Colossoma macropomum TaxID=42526 RepID=UPI0018655877|nr:uncharacterized protein LOC118823343 [Colossoma macropomum]